MAELAELTCDGAEKRKTCYHWTYSAPGGRSEMDFAISQKNTPGGVQRKTRPTTQIEFSLEQCIPVLWRTTTGFCVSLARNDWHMSRPTRYRVRFSPSRGRSGTACSV